MELVCVLQQHLCRVSAWWGTVIVTIAPYLHRDMVVATLVYIFLYVRQCVVPEQHAVFKQQQQQQQSVVSSCWQPQLSSTSASTCKSPSTCNSWDFASTQAVASSSVRLPDAPDARGAAMRRASG